MIKGFVGALVALFFAFLAYVALDTAYAQGAAEQRRHMGTECRASDKTLWVTGFWSYVT